MSAGILHRPALVRTRYAETDQMGFVYHSHFFAYFEIGRCEMIRACGMRYADLEEHGVLLPLRECGAQFHRAARYDDLLAIGTRVEMLTPVRVRFGYEVHRITPAAATPLATGFTEHLFIDRAGKPTRLNKRPEIWQVIERMGRLTTFPEVHPAALIDVPRDGSG